MNPTVSQFKEEGHGTLNFPCGLYEVFEDNVWEGVKHHWHEEIEILYFMEGNFTLSINMENFHISDECFFFVNPGELHAIDICSHVTESAVLFHPRILSFEYYDLVQTGLLQPLLKGEIQFPRMLDFSHPAFYRVKQEYLDIVNVFHQTGVYDTGQHQTITENLSSQLFIRASLLKILGTFSAFSLLTEPQKTGDYRVGIIKSSLEFIRKHYQEKLYIRDLAENVNMNEQYFCRFFKKALGKSPVTYLNEYRIKQAVELLQTTDLPVMDVCLDCGFNNLGNFLREFKKDTGLTPLQYRKRYSNKKS
ncbi:MAG TPA: AraC family transcriptional regulator [Candidatus Blautia pullicola]|uniref:AraC family transcriptional regulator n=1 Tax=Candidatus Blautia pullicola TaxID=2838498 RepID=A0A9D2FTB8_9FIRM|nr:AraC family transcriptional regulator [Candidatus Blautia pullicola]